MRGPISVPAVPASAVRASAGAGLGIGRLEQLWQSVTVHERADLGLCCACRFHGRQYSAFAGRSLATKVSLRESAIASES